MINCEPITAKNRAIRIMDVNIIKNSMIEESITSTLEKFKLKQFRGGVRSSCKT